MFSSTTRMTSPPRPPLAPSGPPSGLHFSRCTEAQPLPPFPALPCSTTRSMNRDMTAGSFLSQLRVSSDDLYFRLQMLPGAHRVLLQQQRGIDRVSSTTVRLHRRLGRDNLLH